MTDILMIEGNHCSKSTAGTISSSSVFCIPKTHIFPSFMTVFRKWVTQNEYTCLTIFILMWTLLNIILVDIRFYFFFNEQPFHIMRFFSGLI